MRTRAKSRATQAGTDVNGLNLMLIKLGLDPFTPKVAKAKKNHQKFQISFRKILRNE